MAKRQSPKTKNLVSLRSAAGHYQRVGREQARALTTNALWFYCSKKEYRSAKVQSGTNASS
jgi:hypothetical protein